MRAWFCVTSLPDKPCNIFDLSSNQINEHVSNIIFHSSPSATMMKKRSTYIVGKCAKDGHSHLLGEHSLGSRHSGSQFHVMDQTFQCSYIST